jgi:DNA-binding NarL/FixJ family response regulator
VAEGEIWADRHTVARFIRELRARQENPAPRDPEAFGSLTPREQEIVWLVAEGYPNQEVATCLGVSVSTVKTHLSHSYQKLHVTTRAQLVRLVLRQRE